MFLNIDQKNPADIAAIDDHEDSLTYGELVRFCDHFGEVLSKRTLIFILSENCIGAFAGYIGALSNKIVIQKADYFRIYYRHTDRNIYGCRNVWGMSTDQKWYSVSNIIYW